MIPLKPVFVLVGLSGALGACKSPMHLSYDFGRAYHTSYNAQPDLTRPSVASSQHGLVGFEASAIRVNTLKAATEEEDTTPTLQAN